MHNKHSDKNSNPAAIPNDSNLKQLRVSSDAYQIQGNQGDNDQGADQIQENLSDNDQGAENHYKLASDLDYDASVKYAGYYPDEPQ